jgi:hypothetical protein
MKNWFNHFLTNGKSAFLNIREIAEETPTYGPNNQSFPYFIYPAI